MNMTMLSQIEENIYALSLDEQLWLIERLAQHIRNGMIAKDNIEAQLIEAEFVITETERSAKRLSETYKRRGEASHSMFG